MFCGGFGRNYVNTYSTEFDRKTGKTPQPATAAATSEAERASFDVSLP
jgi:hypothetical protein